MLGASSNGLKLQHSGPWLTDLMTDSISDCLNWFKSGSPVKMHTIAINSKIKDTALDISFYWLNFSACFSDLPMTDYHVSWLFLSCLITFKKTSEPEPWGVSGWRNVFSCVPNPLMMLNLCMYARSCVFVNGCVCACVCAPVF